MKTQNSSIMLKLLLIFIFLKPLQIWTASSNLTKVESDSTLVFAELFSDKKAVIQWNFVLEESKKIVLNYGINPWQLSEKLVISDSGIKQIILDKLSANTRYYVQFEIESSNRRVKRRFIPEKPILFKTLVSPSRETNRFIDEPKISIYTDTFTIEISTEQFTTVEFNYGSDKNNLSEKLESKIFSKNHILTLNLTENELIFFKICASNIYDRKIEIIKDIKLPAKKSKIENSQRGIRSRRRSR